MIAKPEGDGRVVIEFDRKEHPVLIKYYKNNLGIATALSKIVREWVEGRIRMSEEDEMKILYNRFHNLPSDEKLNIINIIERREQLESHYRASQIITG